ncbi:MAG: LPS assembly lipoprotein LptE [Gemmatimonadetes bacterium]|nr:LPS assembly lipoprotein LptE [Gemmatimonadota bacterium]
MTLSINGCVWRYGLHGGGLPAHIRNVAVLPFDNQTAATDLQRELAEGLRKAFSSRLGLREAPEDRASAIVRGSIVTYEIDAPVAFSANPAQATSARRRLQVRIDVEIFDQTRGIVLWSKKGLTVEGDYAENDEAAGRKQAVERIINEVVEGAQSQW